MVASQKRWLFSQVRLLTDASYSSKKDTVLLSLDSRENTP